MVAGEKQWKVSGRLGMAVIPDFKSIGVDAFLKQNIASCSRV